MRVASGISTYRWAGLSPLILGDWGLPDIVINNDVGNLVDGGQVHLGKIFAVIFRMDQ
jgi:hypothetical protein